ncbi:hypothetical protein ACIGMX_28195 [Streptomyces aquilus]|uniref:DUF3592 domain-containing protein n=1 Tax=Streptomyces aquilus TaxID=2548456 RepID=A0A3Q9BZY6_9ACTN|nr:hypothetical protein [Streptomyces aquilus]AZP18414.1 hypothetical protein EJC51_21370 [Streptomyces aquilus]
MSGEIKEEAGQRTRTRRPVALAAGIGGYALAVIAGMYVLADAVGPALQIPLWIAHAVVLALLIRRLGAKESSAYAALFVVLTSASAVYVIGLARDDLALRQRGEKVTVTVVKEWRDPAEGRRGRDSHYALARQDGTRLPGPAMTTTSDRYDVGETLTVIEDPEAKLAPETPGQADPTAELLGAAALALAALGAIGWMTWRATRNGKEKPRSTSGPEARAAQEERLREALRTHPADRRGYIKLHPEDYPALTHRRAARIAWETGLRTEAAGNRGSWRFKETVVEQVPLD